MVRREPDGDDATEVTIAYVRQLERRLADLEAFVAGKLPHDHDAHYVEIDGDTMTGDLTLDGHGVLPELDSGQFQESDDATNYPPGISYMARSSGDPVWSIGSHLGVLTFRSGARNAQIAVAKDGRDIWFRNVASGENAVWSPWRKFVVLDENGTLQDNLIIRGGNIYLDLANILRLRNGTDSSNRTDFYANNSTDSIVRHYVNGIELNRWNMRAASGGDGYNEVSAYNASGSEAVNVRYEAHNQRTWFAKGHVLISNDLDVVGAKNAQIPPDREGDPTRALRFAASESNTPGIIEVYCGVHTVGASRELTLRQVDLDGLVDEVLLSDYVRIGRNPRVRLDAAGPREDSQPHAPYAWAEWDPTDPRIEVRAPAGDYHVELRFIRNDAGVQGWSHEVDVPPDDEPDV